MSTIIFKSTLDEFTDEAQGKVYINTCVRKSGDIYLQYLLNLSGRDEQKNPIMLTAIVAEVVVHDELNVKRADKYLVQCAGYLRQLIEEKGYIVKDGGYATQEWVIGYIPLPGKEGEVRP